MIRLTNYNYIIVITMDNLILVLTRYAYEDDFKMWAVNFNLGPGVSSLVQEGKYQGKRNTL